MEAPRETVLGKVGEWLALRDAEELTAYAMTARYPGEDMVVTDEEARQAVSVAERVRTRVRAALRELGLESI
jgi:HEPN domain-containing protein